MNNTDDAAIEIYTAAAKLAKVIRDLDSRLYDAEAEIEALKIDKADSKNLQRLQDELNDHKRRHRQ